MHQTRPFGKVFRAITAIALAAAAILAGSAFVRELSALWREDSNDVLTGRTMHEGLRNRQQWLRTVRAAAGMRDHCEKVLASARAAIPEVLAMESQMKGARRWSPALRKALQKKVALQYEEVKPCEAAEMFLGFQGKQSGYFPHLSGLSRFFAAAADALAEKGGILPGERVTRLKNELSRWDDLQECRLESRPRSVLGVIVRAPTWYLSVEAVPTFHGTAAEAWVWLAGWSRQKKMTRAPLLPGEA